MKERPEGGQSSPRSPGGAAALDTIPESKGFLHRERPPPSPGPSDPPRTEAVPPASSRHGPPMEAGRGGASRRPSPDGARILHGRQRGRPGRKGAGWEPAGKPDEGRRSPSRNTPRPKSSRRRAPYSRHRIGGRSPPSRVGARAPAPSAPAGSASAGGIVSR